jgi:hypothetical protein
MDIAGLTAGYQSQMSKSAKSLYKPYWNDLLQTMWDSASEKEKLWLKCDENTNLKRQLKQEYCNACDVFDKHLRKVKRQYQMKLQDDLLNDLEKPNSRDFWKQIGKIGISNERQNTILFEVLGEDGDIITDKKDVLDQWGSDNGTLFDENMQPSAYGDRHLKYVKHANRIGLSVDDNQIPDISYLNAPISRKEVEDAVKRLKLRKAAGIDNIPAEVLKH